MPTMLPAETEAPPWRSSHRTTASESNEDSSAPPVHWRVAWSVVGNLSKALTQSGYLIAMASFGSLEMAGQYALGLAITAPLFVFLNLGLRQLQGTDTDEEFQFADCLTLRLISIALGMLVVAAIILALGYPLETSLIILAVAMCRSIEALADTFHGLFQRHERTDQIALSEGLKSFLSLGAMCLTLALSGNAVAALGAVVIIRTLLLIAQELRWGGTYASIQPRFQGRILLQMCRVAVPLGAVAMFVSLSTNMPRYFLADQHGEQTLGIFALMEMFLQMVLMFTISLQQATSAGLARSYTAGLASFYRYLSYLLCVAVLWGVLSTVGAYWLGPWALGLFLGADGAAYRGAFVLLISAAIAMNVRCILGAGMVVMRRTQIQAVLTCISTVVTAGIAWTLVPRWGITGAAGTIVLSGIVFSTLTATAMLRGRNRAVTSVQVPQLQPLRRAA